MRKPVTHIGLVLVAAAVLVIPGVAVADGGSPVPTLTDEVVDGQDVAVLVTYGGNGEVVTRQVFGEETEGEDLGTTPAAASLRATDTAFVADYGEGGVPSGSGCARFTVRNEDESAIYHATLYWYITWTYWCWDRSDKRTYNIDTGYRIEDVDPTWSWEGNVYRDLHFYEWLSGYTRSGHWHERMGHLQNCFTVLCSNNYPVNKGRVHSDGTWSWTTSD